MTDLRQSYFGTILDMLRIAFESPVSLKDYHDIVSCLRAYDSEGRSDVSNERLELNRLGWPDTYHPCDHMENIRFGLMFVPEDNIRVRDRLAACN
jgi:hypothetical protein